MFAASKSGSAAEPTDAQFNYVTMLLHGDGTNGAQNNTFLDSSTNNFTITRNGNTTQGTFTPYGSNWSNYFDGSGDYLSISDSTAFDLGSGDFTIECWAFTTAWASQYNVLLSQWNASTGYIFRITSGLIGLYANIGGTQNYTATVTNTLNTWDHYAITRSSGTLTFWKNGTSVGTAAISGTINNSSDNVTIGIIGDLNANTTHTGYISNMRLVKGTAVYTSNFTPSTTPLTAISGTSLLTCADNRFIDDSTNNFTITVNGNTSVQRFSPFSPTTAYSTSVIGGSAYFDGNGDYLTTPQNAAFNFGTGAFTVEAWVYITASNGTNQRIIGLGDGAIGGGPYTGWSFNINNNLTTINWYRYDGTETDLNASYTFKTNTWYHIVAVRNGSSNLSMYVNGTRVYNNTGASLSYSNVNSNPLYVGLTYDGAGGGGNKFFNGYMNDARIVAGSAVYDPTSSTLTVPTAPLTAITNTSLLLSYTNAGILDNAMMNDLETVGNAQISTSVKKYGTGSMYFDGTGDAVLALSNPQGDFGSGDFTLEGWFYQTATSNQGYFSKRANTSSYSPFLVQYDSNQLTAYLSTSGSSWAVAINASTNPSTNTWNHVAFVRNGSTATLYLNGTSVGSASISGSLMTNSTPVVIGAQASDASNVFNGYIDDLRITKGVARYTTTFTPPTAAFPNN